MAGRPPAGATFEVGRVGRSRSRPPLGILFWAGVLVVIVAGGILGRVTAPSDDPNGVARLSPPAASPAEAPSAALSGPIDLQAPAIGPITLTTPTLFVYGRTLVHVTRLEIALEARNNRVLDSVSLDVSNLTDGVREDRQPLFHAEFDVPDPRPSGTMWVVVTAYDELGLPLGGERRPFIVGPLKAASESSVFVFDPRVDQKRCGPSPEGRRCG